MEGFNTFEKQDKVLLGMSGGVDSSVAVRILQEQGFSVQGAVIRFSSAHDGAVAAARETANTLQIPLHVLDAEQAFETHVITPFCENYCAGRTPNPCIICNPLVKFRLLAEKAAELGCAFIATGHYARVEVCEDGINRIAVPESTARDQSYMLYRLPQDILKKLILPLGEFEKEDIREMALEMNLACADAPDSMEICFIPSGDYAAWLEEHGFSTPVGNYVDNCGKVLGQHNGIHHYTLGQGRGLGVSGPHRYYVSAIRPETNEVVLSNGSDLGREVVYGAQPNWLAIDGLTGPMEVTVRLRHSRTEQEAVLSCEGEGIRLDMKTPARAPTPGQLAVFYQGDAVVGSAWIL